MGLYEREGIWYARWNAGGKTQRRSLGTRDRGEAESMFRRLTGRPLNRRTKSQRRHIARATLEAKAPPVTFGDLCDRWRAHLDGGHAHLKRSTVEAYLVQLRRFHEMWGNLAVNGLTAQHVEDWCHERNGQAANATLKAERQVLRVFLRWAASPTRKLIDRVPEIPRTRGVSKKVPRPLSEDEVQSIFETVRTHPKVQVRALESFVMVQLHCGLRRDEARFLRWTDIDFPSNELHVTNKESDGFTIKDHEERAIPMNPALRAYLERLIQRPVSTDWVCVNDRFEQWSLGVSGWFRELWDGAGISRDHGTSHRLRHTFATTLLRAGVDLATLRDLMGHSDISVTSQYLGATPQRQEAVAALAALPGPRSGSE